MARPRSRWDDDDDLRPLTHRGRDQAAAIVKQLGDYEIDRVLSSPSVRCVDTVAPLAAKRGLAVIVDERLAEGNGHLAVKLVHKLLRDQADVALCSHGDVVPEVIDALGFRCEWCAKGSTWVLTADAALYLPPPT